MLALAGLLVPVSIFMKDWLLLAWAALAGTFYVDRVVQMPGWWRPVETVSLVGVLVVGAALIVRYLRARAASRKA
jgi:hypothetical protein